MSLIIIVKADANLYPRMLLVCYVIADIVVLYQTILYSYTTVVTIIVPPHCLLHNLIFLLVTPLLPLLMCVSFFFLLVLSYLSLHYAIV